MRSKRGGMFKMLLWDFWQRMGHELINIHLGTDDSPCVVRPCFNPLKTIWFCNYMHFPWTPARVYSGLVFNGFMKARNVTWYQLNHSRLTLRVHCYPGWPRKNATLTINNFKKMRDRMKTCALWHIKFFSQQDDTKIVNFDEGVLIILPFFWGNDIFKICPSFSKVTIYVPKIFYCLASPSKVSALAL